MTPHQEALFVEERKWDYRREFMLLYYQSYPDSIPISIRHRFHPNLRPYPIRLPMPSQLSSHPHSYLSHSFPSPCPYHITNHHHQHHPVFGFTAALPESLPIIGLAFTISNRVGAAMWAHGEFGLLS
jgi:hypothetical protein